MLSNLIITNQQSVLVVDNIGQEKIALRFLCQLLREQGEVDASVKRLPFNNALAQEATFQTFLADCAQPSECKLNVILPPLSDLLCYQRPAVIFQFLHKLRLCANVKRSFLWATIPNLIEHADYLIAACEYMADLVLHLKTDTELSIITRKPGGGVTNKHYTYTNSKNEFLVQPAVATKTIEVSTPTTKPEDIGTFKIELDEDELVARNSMKLPYEKTSDNVANIIYTPDANDDFDDEDPDEDLCI